MISGVGFFTSSFAADLTVFSFFLSSSGWTDLVFVFFFCTVLIPYYPDAFLLFFYLYLPLAWFFDPWHYFPTSLLFYQNTLLTNSLNLVHPILVTGSTVFLLSSCLSLTGLCFSPRPFYFYFYFYFLHFRQALYFLLMAGVALLFGCFWALQLSTWGGWWVWENSELFLLFLFFLLVTLLHTYFIISRFSLTNSLAILLLIEYIVFWLFVFWWNPNSLHTFSAISGFFFHHYFAITAGLLLFFTLNVRCVNAAPYLFFHNFFPPTLLLGCWVGLWFNWTSLLGGFFLITASYVFMKARVFRPRMVLINHLFFLVFLVLVVFFNFNPDAPTVVWLPGSCFMSFIYFLEAVTTNLYFLPYLQTDLTYSGNLYYLPHTGLGFTLHNSRSTLAYLDPTFVFLCVSVTCFYDWSLLQ